MIGPDGYSGLELGMRVKAAVRDQIFVDAKPLTGKCGRWHTAPSSPIDFVWVSAKFGLVAIQVRANAVATPEGMTFRTPAAAVKKMYPIYRYSPLAIRTSAPRSTLIQ